MAKHIYAETDCIITSWYLPFERIEVFNLAIGDGVSALASLGVTFGGFSPTAMDGVTASKEYVEQLEIANAKRKAAEQRRRELERARTSDPRTFADNAGIWTYVVIDNEVVRIVGLASREYAVEIPSTIDGMPVVAIGPDACARNDYIQEIVCPDSVQSIGSCAFRFCQNLRKVVFPKDIGEYSASWLSHCPSLVEVVLPGALDTVTLSVFDNPGLKKLVIGASVHDIEPGAFQKTQLTALEIDSDNPFIRSDGDAIYTIDGSVLLALARPVERYDVARGCVAIGKKAFFGIDSLREVNIAETVKVFGEFSFAHCGIASLKTPRSLEEIQAKSFFYCKNLKSIELNEGLRLIGDSAFEQSSLERLHIPASIERIGKSITVATSIVHAGPECTIEIDSKSKSLFLDGEGGLYRRDADGVHIVQLIDPDAAHYKGFEGMVSVDPYAFAFNPSIEYVELPDGVVSIGDSAFRCSGNLKNVVVPDSVTAIGKDAFLDTSLESFRIPRSLESLGTNALVTANAHHGDKRPSLNRIEVAPGNERYFVKSGMLCENSDNGARALLFSNTESHVVFPPEVETVADYAFNNARGIDYLEIGPNLRLIGTNGLTTWCWIEHIHIVVAEPIEGRTAFDFRFPNTRKGVHGISIGIGGASWVNVPGIMAQYDNCIANAHDYNSPRNPDSIAVYDQVKKIVERLDDPILLTPVNRGMFDRLLRNYIVEICVDVARHDDRMVVNKLVELGYINEDNIEQLIAAVRSLQDAAMTGYLLEVRRRRFERVAFDYDL